MNKRIRELAEQAGFYYTDKTGFITPAGCDPAKFAKLIVRECADLFHLTFTDEQYQRRIDKTIKEHFGVEE